MARQNRRDLFDPHEIGVYHCMQRTVRRAWLCGQDPLTGNSFEHRRAWIQKRMEKIAASYGLDILSYAIMANHIHIIVRNRPDVVATWSDEQVVRRWWKLFPWGVLLGPPILYRMAFDTVDKSQRSRRIPCAVYQNSQHIPGCERRGEARFLLFSAVSTSHRQGWVALMRRDTFKSEAH